MHKRRIPRISHQMAARIRHRGVYSNSPWGSTCSEPVTYSLMSVPCVQISLRIGKMQTMRDSSVWVTGNNALYFTFVYWYLDDTHARSFEVIIYLSLTRPLCSARDCTLYIGLRFVYCCSALHQWRLRSVFFLGGGTLLCKCSVLD